MSGARRGPHTGAPMNISELIMTLEMIRGQNGDLPVGRVAVHPLVSPITEAEIRSVEWTNGEPDCVAVVLRDGGEAGH